MQCVLISANGEVMHWCLV